MVESPTLRPKSQLRAYAKLVTVWGPAIFMTLPKPASGEEYKI